MFWIGGIKPLDIITPLQNTCCRVIIFFVWKYVLVRFPGVLMKNVSCWYLPNLSSLSTQKHGKPSTHRICISDISTWRILCGPWNHFLDYYFDYSQNWSLYKARHRRNMLQLQLVVGFPRSKTHVSQSSHTNAHFYAWLLCRKDIHVWDAWFMIHEMSIIHSPFILNIISAWSHVI